MSSASGIQQKEKESQETGSDVSPKKIRSDIGSGQEKDDSRSQSSHVPSISTKHSKKKKGTGKKKGKENKEAEELPPEPTTHEREE